jgi:hypothetical protein
MWLSLPALRWRRASGIRKTPGSRRKPEEVRDALFEPRKRAAAVNHRSELARGPSERAYTLPESEYSPLHTRRIAQLLIGENCQKGCNGYLASGHDFAGKTG